jgi:hypothetical protein
LHIFRNCEKRLLGAGVLSVVRGLSIVITVFWRWLDCSFAFFSVGLSVEKKANVQANALAIFLF